MRRALIALAFILAAAAASAQQGVAISVRNGTVDPPQCKPTSLNVFLNRTSNLLKICTATNTWGPIDTLSVLTLATGNIAMVASDFTTANNASLQTITGLSFILPANTAGNYPVTCELMYSQATAAVADQFGIQAASLAPTNISAKANVDISASTYTAANLPTLNTTTATAIVTFTPSVITTIWNARLTAMIENPSGVANTINIMAQTSAGADAVTVKRGSYCIVGF